MAKRLPSPEHADTLSLNALRGLVTGLLERSQQVVARLSKLEAKTVQFRLGNHALCWVHAERLLQKLMPRTKKEEWLRTLVRELVWRFYKGLKAYKQKPSPQAALGVRLRFDHIFGLRAGYEALDKLLARQLRSKTELLKVLDHPDIPLHTNASENDLRTLVTKRKISGGTMSRNGRVARDVMFGLMKTCQKLGLSFSRYLGDPPGLGNIDQPVPPLPTIILARASVSAAAPGRPHHHHLPEGPAPPTNLPRFPPQNAYVGQNRWQRFGSRG